MRLALIPDRIPALLGLTCFIALTCGFAELALDYARSRREIIPRRAHLSGFLDAPNRLDLHTA